MPLIAASLLYNCGGSDDSVFTPPVDTPVTTPELIVTEAGTGDKREISINTDKLVAPVLVKFATTSESMRRLYITSNVNGLGADPYTFENPDVDSKADGSVDLKSDTKKELEYLINFPTPTEDNSTIVYTLWTTTGRGDFRDAAKRNAIPVGEGEAATVGTITITKGTGGTSESGNLRNLGTIKLKAPLSDESSDTFMSVFNGKTYKINDKETAALWDFGFYYLVKSGATLASPQVYNTDVINVPNVSGIAVGDLNKFYFKKSTKTVQNFDDASLNSDLDFDAPTSQDVQSLKVNDIIEFADQYGNKGLMKVTALKESYGSDGYIDITIKVQN